MVLVSFELSLYSCIAGLHDDIQWGVMIYFL